jgi:hypothetical protein
MERIRELWADWWKLLAIFVVIAGVMWFVWDCNRGERAEFLACMEDELPPGHDVLYDTGGSGEPDAYYDLINRYDAVDVAEDYYDDTQGLSSDGEALEFL